MDAVSVTPLAQVEEAPETVHEAETCSIQQKQEITVVGTPRISKLDDRTWARVASLSK